ncbi:apolipoprotein C-I, isoform CRA_b [Rattus norvegicus]|uniref:Apolipoprotein C-I, isoform CRA_b n=1 Tax=Rattus norvegicus TaxID=10116 RepID=A6J8R2_RAT|nr:apolipoprotein C-I, isoform CRA_b [Rattus norvegicus]
MPPIRARLPPGCPSSQDEALHRTSCPDRGRSHGFGRNWFSETLNKMKEKLKTTFA